MQQMTFVLYCMYTVFMLTILGTGIQLKTYKQEQAIVKRY